MNTRIVLASQSVHRKKLMENAGLTFKSCAAEINERAIEATIKNTGATPKEIALVLANEKALNVSQKFLDSYIIGSDQTLSLDGEILHKPENMAIAHHRLLRLSGKTHTLDSALSIVRNNEKLYQYVSSADLTMRNVTVEFIDQYLAKTGPEILSSVGAYQLEKEGVQLFEKIDGDFFTIIGLPMLPLLQKLRELGIICG